MLSGPVSIGTIDQWQVGPGSVVSWHPAEASKAKAAAAPVSSVPPAYMQANHIRGYKRYEDQGLDYSRLMIAAFDVPGQCDQRTMNYVINAHVRRHDTYRSWFELQGDDVIRHTMDNPSQIKMVPTKHGEMSDSEFRDLLMSTPSPVDWDCFTFGIVQCDDHFTFYMCVDHVHTDAQFLGVVIMEFQFMYMALVGGNPPLKLPEPSTYENFCIRQHEYCDGLTINSPEVQVWTDFAAKNEASFPTFPLPLGIEEGTAPCAGELVTFELMDEDQMHSFELACSAAGSRVIGGLFAGLALAEHQISGTAVYTGLTTTNGREPDEMLTMGWCTGMVPITIPIEGATFADAARAAQDSFDTGLGAARVPFDRIMELAPSLEKPRAGFPQLNYLDIGLPPLSAFLSSDLNEANIGMYFDGRFSNPLIISVVRLRTKAVALVLYPGNPIARESVGIFVEAFRSALVQVADKHKATLPDLAKA